MRTTKKLSQFIWDFNKAIVYQHRAFMSPNFLGLENVLENFYKDGIIPGYRVHKTQVEVFMLVDSVGRIGPTKIKNLSKPSLLIAARVKELKAEIRDRHHTSSIIRTAKYGLTTAKFAAKNKTGGHILGRLI
jgi:ribosomal protein S8